MKSTLSKIELTSPSYPWLANNEICDDEVIILFSIHNRKYYKHTIPDTKKTTLCTSFGGWFMMMEDTGDVSSHNYYILNPISMEKVELPPSEVDFGWNYVCFLSSSPKDSNCYVLCIDNSWKVIWFCKPGDEKFLKQEYEAALEHLWSPTIFEGKLYCLTEPDSSLVIIELKDLELQLTKILVLEVSCLPPPGTLRPIEYLIECCGELMLVSKAYTGFGGDDVYGFTIFRFDMVHKKWMEINNIGRWTIFLSRDKGTCCIAEESGIKQNSIYFVESFDRCLYVYDLEDHSISMFSICPTKSCLCEFEWVVFADNDQKNLESTAQFVDDGIASLN